MDRRECAQSSRQPLRSANQNGNRKEPPGTQKHTDQLEFRGTSGDGVSRRDGQVNIWRKPRTLGRVATIGEVHEQRVAEDLLALPPLRSRKSLLLGSSSASNRRESLKAARRRHRQSAEGREIIAIANATIGATTLAWSIMVLKTCPD